MKKSFRRISAAALALFLLLGIVLSNRTYAITGSVTISPSQGQFDQGGTYTVYIAINGSEAFSFSGNIAVSGGGTFKSADASLQSDGGTLIIVPTATAVAGNIQVAVGGTGSVTIAVSGTMLSADTGDQISVSKSVSVPIRSTADREAAEAAARAASEAEAARQASIWAEESSRQASIQAEQDAINASIWAEQSRQASIEAEQQAAYNSSVAESASIEESIALESASIQESIEEESKKESRMASMEEWSRSVESSKVEATRAFLDKGIYFVPYDTMLRRSERFLFAVADTAVEAPEYFVKTALNVNKQDVLAYRLDGFSENTYIVYGCYDNGNDKPAFYLYDAKNERFFPVDAVGELRGAEAAVDKELQETEEAAEENESKQRSGPGFFMTVLACVLSLILGAAILLLVLTLLKRKQEAEEGAEMEGLSFIPFIFKKNKGNAAGEAPDEAEDTETPSEEVSEAPAEAAPEEAAAAAEASAEAAPEETLPEDADAEAPAETAEEPLPDVDTSVEDLLDAVALEIGGDAPDDLPPEKTE